MQPTPIVAALAKIGLADLLPPWVLDASAPIKAAVAATILVVPGLLTAFVVYLVLRRLFRRRRRPTPALPRP